jgi:hypothetical protein
VLDVTHMPSETSGSGTSGEEYLKKVSKGVTVESTDTCFVMMPFANLIGGYYEAIYEPAIKKAGLTLVRRYRHLRDRQDRR